MSTTTPPPAAPSGQPEYAPRNAKADAKAAKAYYKAQRPWYKKKRFIFLIALVGLIVIIVAMNSGGGGNSVTKTASDAPSKSTTGESSAPKAKKEVTKNKAAHKGPLTVGNWEVVGKIVPKDDGLGDFGATFRVKNTSESSDTGLFTLNLLTGDDLAASMDCAGPETSAGSIGTVDCVSTDKYTKKWKTLTLENSF